MLTLQNLDLDTHVHLKKNEILEKELQFYNAVLNTILTSSADSDDGGTAPQAAESCGSNGVSIGTRLSPCCTFSLGGPCTPKGWHNLAICADAVGDIIFDLRGPQGCQDKFNGLSNNFAAQQWCKHVGKDDCWLPYSMQVDNKCFSYDKDDVGQWDTGDSYL